MKTMPSNRRLAVLAPLLLGTALTACGDDAPTHSASDPSEAADASVASRADAGPPKAGIDASSSNLLDAHAPTEQTEDGSLSGPDAQALTDAALPSAWDGQVADGQAADAGQDATVPAAMRVCPADALCTRPEYPCVPSDDGAGYQCRGQFASWLVAEKVAGSKAAPKYTVDAAQGVVLDEVTGLLWQRELPATFKGCSGVIDNVTGAGCSVDEAQAYCAQLPLAGKAWRLPTKIELESLLDFVTAPRKQAIDPDVFDTVSLHDGFWSASPELLGPGKNYMVRHSIGLTGVEPTDTPERVRCVHSERIADAQPQNRYLVDTQADTARDQFTHLEWQRGIS
ncbi:MAG: hypothetical protein JWN04_3486, partial [Myxococcaceae bacterium]|nr:hypothetical protein [Myxococcaceae bacterium]